jgi:hypothetical protein
LAPQSGFEAIDENAGRAQTGEPNVRRNADAKLCVERQCLEIEPGRRDVFTEIPGTNVEA